MSNQALAIHQKLILFGFAAEDWMIFKDQTFGVGLRLSLEEKRGSQAADAASNNYAIVSLAGIDYLSRRRIGDSIANFVSCLDYLPGVSVGVFVFTNSPVSGELVGLREQLGGSERFEQECARSEKRRAQEIAACDGVLHPQNFVAADVRLPFRHL